MLKKCCNSCNEEKDIGFFRKDAHIKSGRAGTCKICARLKASAVHALKYKEKYADICKTRSLRAAAIVREAKQGGCTLCSERELCCITFHHLDPKEKDFTIANARNYNEVKILAEIKKCIIVCGNCHDKIHAGIINVSTLDNHNRLS